jgi:hypothetical protein
VREFKGHLAALQRQYAQFSSTTATSSVGGVGLANGASLTSVASSGGSYLQGNGSLLYFGTKTSNCTGKRHIKTLIRKVLFAQS